MASTGRSFTAEYLQGGAGSQTVVVDQAVETDTAGVVTFITAQFFPVGQAVETDTATGVVFFFNQFFPIGQATETDTGRTITLSPIVIPAPIVYDVDVRSRADLTTSIVALDGLVSLSGGARLSDTAPWSAEIAYDADCLSALTNGRLVCLLIGGNIIWAGRIDRIDKHPVAGGEESSENVLVTGVDIAGDLDRINVKPTRGFNKKPWSHNRDFSFASPEFDASSWGNASVIIAANGSPSTFWTGKPSGFPALNIPWIGPSTGTDLAAPQGYVYLLLDGSLAADTIIRDFVGADNGGWSFLNGFLLRTIDPSAGDTTQGFTETSQGSIFATTGAVRFAFKMVNAPFGGGDPGPGQGPTLAGNPVGLLGIWFASDSSGRLFARIGQTSASWKCLAYPATPPGLTATHILKIIKDENQADGLFPELAYDFGVDTDTSSSAMPQIELFSTRVGDSLFKIARDMGLAHIDWRMSYSNYKMQVWNHGAGGAPSGVTYALTNDPETSKIADFQSQKYYENIDVLIVEHGDGQIRVPTTGGTIIGFLSIPGAAAGTAKLVAQQVLNQQGANESIVVTIAPTGINDIPGIHVLPGDSLSVNAGAFGTFNERLLEWTFAITDDGIDWGISIRSLFIDDIEVLARTIQRYQSGGVGGAAPSGPTNPPPQFGRQGQSNELTFQFDDNPTTPLESPDKIPHESGNLYAVAITAKTAGASATTFQFRVNGVDVLNGGGILPAGQLFALIPIPVAIAAGQTVWLEANVARLAARIVTYPIGITGILIEPRIV